MSPLPVENSVIEQHGWLQDLNMHKIVTFFWDHA